MKKSILTRSISIILATSLMLGMTACGDSSNTDSSSEVSSSGSEGIKGETKTWGSYTVLVPEGWYLKGGDVFDEKDENNPLYFGSNRKRRRRFS